MARTAATETRRRVTFPAVAAVTALLLVVGGYALLHVVVSSPFAAGKTSAYLTRLLRQPVSVTGLSLDFPAVTVHNLTIGNPSPFPRGNLVSVRTLRIFPRWTEMVTGRTSLDSITIKGLTVNVLKDRQGNGNYSPLLQALSARKSGGVGAETLIRRIVVEPAAVTVNNVGIGDVALTVRDLATRGSMVAAIEGRGRHASGEFRLRGTVRPGKGLWAEIVLDAPSLALGNLIPATSRIPRAGSGMLNVKAEVDPRNVSATIRVECTGVDIPVRGEQLPVAAAALIRLRYDRETDMLRIEPSTCTVNGLLSVTATGAVEKVRNARRFRLDVESSPLSLADLAGALPPRLRGKIDPAGRLLPVRFTATGDGKRGIVAATGEASIREGGVSKGGKVIVRDVAADIILTKAAEGWKAKGAIKQTVVGNDSLVRNLAGTFKGEFTDRMRLRILEAPELSMLIAGSACSGAVLYDPRRLSPLTLSVNVPELPLAALNPFLDGKARFSTGTVSFSADGSGRNAGSFAGTVRAQFRGVSGSVGKSAFAAGGAETVASVVGNGGGVSISGGFDLRDGLVAGKPAAGSLRYAATKETVSLEKGKLRVSGTECAFGRIDGELPRRPVDPKKLPVHLSFSGVEVRRGDEGATNLSGVIDASVNRDGQGAWLGGRADLRGGDVYLKRKKVATLRSRMVFEKRSVATEVEGTLFGGRMNGKGRLDLSGQSPSASFEAEVSGAEAAAISSLLDTTKVAASAGKVDVRMTGGYTPGPGVSAKVNLTGAGFTVVTPSRKTIVTDAGLSIEGELLGERLAIEGGRLWAGPEMTASFSGTINRPLSVDRSGDIRITLPVTHLEPLVGTLINVLPRSIQEATVTGSVASDSVVRLRGKDLHIDGRVELAGSGLDIPAQKLTVTGARGTVPFSLILGHSPGNVHRNDQHPNRDTYPGFLQFLQFGPNRGSLLIVERIGFGALEFGRTVIQWEAAEGVTHLNSFNSSLAGGILVGRGYYAPGNNPVYGGDLLVNGLSLRAICASFPAIKGYISGKVDGIVSLAGAGKGNEGLTAFAELWARETKEEKMLVNKDFLQKLAGKNLRGIFFREDRPYDRGEIGAYLENGYLTFSTLDISNTNFFGVRDLSVTVAPAQNRISMDHLIDAVRQAAARGKAVKGGDTPEPSPETEFQWEE